MSSPENRSTGGPTEVASGAGVGPYALLANCRRLCQAEQKETPNWVIASELFGVGSTSAKRVCRSAGIDPDAFVVTPVPRRATAFDSLQGAA